MDLMRKSARVWTLRMLLAALALLCVAPARAQTVRVTAIDIRGNQRINREAILSVVSTKVGDELSPERLERDRVAIESLGWFSSVVVNRELVGDGAHVVFTVVEYPQVQELQITGSTIFTEAQLRAALKTKNGQVFNRVDWESDQNTLINMYKNRGYLIRPVFNLDQPDFQERGILRLEIRELRIATVTLRWPSREVRNAQGAVIRRESLHKTHDYVVLRELSQRQGALYNDQDLARDYRELTGLGFFESVNPVVTPSPEEPDAVDITWEITEKRTGQISVGAGYSQTARLIGRAELADTNFQGRGRSVSVALEQGTFGGDGAPSVEVQYYEPWLTATKTSLNVDLYDKLVYRFDEALQSNQDTPYFERRLGGQLSFGRPFQWPIVLGVRMDHVTTGHFPRALNFPAQNGNVEALSISHTVNNRDYNNNPTHGHLYRYSTEIGNFNLTKTNADTFKEGQFDKLIGDWRWYIPLAKNRATKEPEREQRSQKVPVIAFRALAGTTIGRVPFFEQFFIGGAESLRGYLEDRFWGKNMFLASVEYRRPIINRIVGVVFVDVGDAWGTQSIFQFNKSTFGTDFHQTQSISIFPAVGVGLRIATPIGPIRFDYGIGREGGQPAFSIGHIF